MLINKEENIFGCVIRQSGERTFETMRSIVEDFFGKTNVSFVSGFSFEEVLENSLVEASKLNCQWVLVLDADVIPSFKGLAKICVGAREQKENVIGIQARVFDFSFGGWRDAGNHFYRSSAIPHLLNFIPKPGVSLRPETYMIKKACTAGYKYKSLNIKLGIHDFFQHFEDYFRKGIVFFKKFRPYLPVLEFYWRRKSNGQDGYMALMLAISYCRKNQIEEVRLRGDDLRGLCPDIRIDYNGIGTPVFHLCAPEFYIFRIYTFYRQIKAKVFLRFKKAMELIKDV